VCRAVAPPLLVARWPPLSIDILLARRSAANPQQWRPNGGIDAQTPDRFIEITYRLQSDPFCVEWDVKPYSPLFTLLLSMSVFLLFSFSVFTLF